MNEQENQPTSDYRPPAADRIWLVAESIITAIAAFLRFYDLELRPLHHDEGVNGFFLTTLFRDGVYKYDPQNYHGPDLYYFALAVSKMFGLNTTSIRGSVAIFGVLTVVLAFFLRRYIGNVGSLVAALFLALSPGMVFISRYFIHEILFVFFSFAIVVSVIYFVERRAAGAWAIASMTFLLLVCFLPTALNLANQIGEDNRTLVWIVRIGLLAVEAVLVFLLMRALLAWRGGSPIYLLLASASAILLFATKETAFITIGTMLIACVCVWIWRRIRPVLFDIINEKEKQNELEKVELTWASFRRALGDSGDLTLLVVACAVVFAYVGVLFFSSFFTYSDGIGKAFQAYALWTKTGTKDHTMNGWLAYVKWGMKLESPILIVSFIGTLVALVKARHRFAVFAGFWAFGLFAAYTIIPYKTPWLALSFLLPMCVVAGYGVNELITNTDKTVKLLGWLLLIMSAAILAFQTYDLNFKRYDDDQMPYVYAHTKRGFLDLITKIEYYSEKSGRGRDAQIDIVSPDYWALPWYLRDYKSAIFHGQFADVATSELIVASTAQQDELVERYGARYKYAGTYPLRPGVDLVLLVRKNLADADAQEIYKIAETAP